jgi:opacity protein-like surface antigen
MRKAILGAASALALASPAVAADYPVPRYSEVPSYEREAHTYEYRRAPPILVEEPWKRTGCSFSRRSNFSSTERA